MNASKYQNTSLFYHNLIKTFLSIISLSMCLKVKAFPIKTFELIEFIEFIEFIDTSIL
jgi:hypothetical protein